MEDTELLERWRAGDKKAGVDLFDRHYEAVLRFFRNKAGDDAADLVQRTFLALVESRDRYQGDASFRTFVFAVAKNVLYNHYRSKERAPEMDFSVVSIADLAPTASGVLVRRSEERLLLEALRRLPLDYQVALELYYWESMTAADLGRVMGVPEGTARTRIRRAKELVEEQLRALVESPAELTSTVGDLDGWASGLRRRMGEGEARPKG
jgi:RNA polymerase sigma-70 factor (ECF subfamily)